MQTDTLQYFVVATESRQAAYNKEGDQVTKGGTRGHVYLVP
jgi:hypothetical protein